MLTFIKDNKTIIGTLLGVILGFILNIIRENLKNRGKIYYNFSNLTLEYEGEDQYGITTYEENIDNLHNVNTFLCKMNMKITNDSTKIKALRDIKLSFILDNNELLEGVPYILKSKGEFLNKYEDLSLIQLNPGETKSIDLSVSIKKENIISKINFKKVYFNAINVKGKKVKIKIKNY